MGDPKKPRKKFSRPKSPWRSDQLAQELYMLGAYGLRNKRELWRAQTLLSSTRKQARTLLAATEEVRLREEKKLLTSLEKRGLVRDGAILDDILNLTIEDVLMRRLQTMVFKKGLATSPLHSRQLIVHGHVMLGANRVTIPGYYVGRDEEETLKLVGKRSEEPTPEPPQATEQATPAKEEEKIEAQPVPAEGS
jgi:small subunit ribosomal protein S4